jgi:hypothetical protein
MKILLFDVVHDNQSLVCRVLTDLSSIDVPLVLILVRMAGRILELIVPVFKPAQERVQKLLDIVRIVSMEFVEAQIEPQVPRCQPRIFVLWVLHRLYLELVLGLGHVLVHMDDRRFLVVF